MYWHLLTGDDGGDCFNALLDKSPDHDQVNNLTCGWILWTHSMTNVSKEKFCKNDCKADQAGEEGRTWRGGGGRGRRHHHFAHFKVGNPFLQKSSLTLLMLSSNPHIWEKVWTKNYCPFSGIQIRRPTASGDTKRTEQNFWRHKSWICLKVGAWERCFQKHPIHRICHHPPQHWQ